MSNTLKFGNGEWYGKEGTILAYNSENNNYKPLPFTFDRASSATRVNKDGLIETVGADQPRVDYLNDSNGALLLEPSRTNNLLRSEEFDNASWTKFSSGTGIAPVVTANYTTSPDGSNNADRVVFDKGSGTGGSDFSQMRQIVSDVGQGVSSVYIKSNTSDSYTMGIDPVGNATLITITPEWQRFTYSETTNDRLAIGLRASQTSNYADVSIWGAQMEAGSYATSYIPTQGSAVTRLADSCSQTVPDGVIGQTEGVVFIEVGKINNNSVTGAAKWFMEIRKDANNSFGFGSGGADASPPIRFVTQITGAYTTEIEIPNFSNSKIAISYNSTNFKIFQNGTLRHTVNKNIGDYSEIEFLEGASTDLRMIVKNFKLYNEALTDQELQALTT